MTPLELGIQSHACHVPYSENRTLTRRPQLDVYFAMPATQMDEMTYTLMARTTKEASPADLERCGPH